MNTVNEPTSVEEAQRLVDEAVRRLQEAELAAERALAEEREGTKRYDAKRTDKGALHAAKLRVARESHERDVADRKREVESARAALAAAQAISDRDALNVAVTFCQRLPNQIASELAELVELDRRAGAILDKLADAVVAGEEAFDDATTLAAHLRCEVDLQRQIVKPTIEWVQLLAKVALSRARTVEGRSGNPFMLAGRTPDWDSPSRPEWDKAVATIERLEKESSQ